MKKKVRKILIAIIGVSLIIYITMLINTNILMDYVRDVFAWKVDSSETIGKPINRYNHRLANADIELGNFELTLVRIFTLHNFKDGYIWVYYSYEARDPEGEIITGSWRIPSKWKIHKENGKWEIIEITEAP